MKKFFSAAILSLFALTGMAQEKVIDIQKKDGTTTRTRVADLKQISFYPLDKDDLSQQPSIMFMKLANGALMRNNMDDVRDITFADATFNINVKYKKTKLLAGDKFPIEHNKKTGDVTIHMPPTSYAIIKLQ